MFYWKQFWSNDSLLQYMFESWRTCILKACIKNKFEVFKIGRKWGEKIAPKTILLGFYCLFTNFQIYAAVATESQKLNSWVIYWFSKEKSCAILSFEIKRNDHEIPLVYFVLESYF